MNTYTITTRSTLYTTYEVEAENEAEARKILDDARYDELCEDTSWTEDTEVAYIDIELYEEEEV